MYRVIRLYSCYEKVFQREEQRFLIRRSQRSSTFRIGCLLRLLHQHPEHTSCIIPRAPAACRACLLVPSLPAHQIRSVLGVDTRLFGLLGTGTLESVATGFLPPTRLKIYISSLRPIRPLDIHSQTHSAVSAKEHLDQSLPPLVPC
jgi:hypothetical protein